MQHIRQCIRQCPMQHTMYCTMHYVPNALLLTTRSIGGGETNSFGVAVAAASLVLFVVLIPLAMLPIMDAVETATLLCMDEAATAILLSMAAAASNP